MIYTCTVNPSLDYYLKVENEIKVGEINRSTDSHFEAGGKGVNVSIALNNLMLPSNALGFLGGFNEEFYLSFLNKYPYIRPRFTSIKGHTRINVKIRSSKESDINAKGPSISKEELSRFLKKADNIDLDDFFILSGNVQEEIFESIYELIKELSNRGVKIILDTNPELMKRCLEFKPTLIKPNLEELEDLTNEIIDSEEKLINIAKKLVNEGAINVLVSLGGDGAILANDNGIYKSEGINVDDVISTTGCGDSMVGGFVFNMQRGANDEECFKYACASGLATALSESIATKAEIEKWYDKIEIRREIKK